MKFEDAQEAFYAQQTNETAAYYIMAAMQDFNDNDLTEPVRFIQAAGEVAFWLKWDRLHKFHPPE